MDGKRFLDSQGRVLFTSSGISQGKHFCTLERTATNSLRRIKSPALPERKKQADAEANLAAYAKKRRMVEI